MADVILLTITLVFLVIVILGALILYAKCYVRVPPNKVLVIFGRQLQDPNTAYSFVLHGGHFIVPIFEDFGFMPLETFMDNLELNDVVTKDHNHLRLSLLFDYRIRSDLKASRRPLRTSMERATRP